MTLESKEYKEEFERLLNLDGEKKFYIRRSNALYKIKLFLEKAKGSFSLVDYLSRCKNVDTLFVNYWMIIVAYYSMLYAAKAAVLTKGYETDDHYATQIALGYLFIPSQMEKEDLELLEQSYKLFEDEYVEYFEDARKESSTARYAAIKKYSERRVKTIVNNAQRFLAKIDLILA